MQVKKFEAPTLQEALDAIKRELGPEAIILQTKTNKKGFGLMSKGSVEITAAVSERSLMKKKVTESKVPEKTREQIYRMPAEQQAKLYDDTLDRQLEKMAKSTSDQVQIRKQPASNTRMAPGGQVQVETVSYSARSTSQMPSAAQTQAATLVQQRRYADIQDEPETAEKPKGIQDRIQSLFNPKQSLEDEVKHLKRMLDELKTSQDQMIPQAGAGAVSGGARILQTDALQEAFEQLVIHGVEKRHALALVKQVGFELGQQANDPDAVMDSIAHEMVRATQALPLLQGIEPRAQSGLNAPVVIALVGPTGVGKTTTVAKIAGVASLQKKLKVALINLDSYKVGAFEQLATYAKIMNVPFRSVASRDDLQLAIQDFQSYDLVLIDTTGRSHRDQSSLREMQGIIQSIPGVRVELVLSVTTRDSELQEMGNCFSVFHPEGIIFSKLDEGTLFGCLYSVSQRLKLPLLAFGTGQRVPEDWEDASSERVAALIMDL